jgi:hypothetical protein
MVPYSINLASVHVVIQNTYIMSVVPQHIHSILPLNSHIPYSLHGVYVAMGLVLDP